MPTHASETTRSADGLGGAVTRVADHAKSLVSLEVELAKLELRRKAAGLGVGVGLLATAGVFGLFVLAMLFHGTAWAFATLLPIWVAFFVTAGIALLFTLVLALAGIAAVRRGTPPVPEQAIEEAKRTTEVLKSNGRH